MNIRLPCRVADTNSERISEIRDAEGHTVCYVPMQHAEQKVKELNDDRDGSQVSSA